MNTKNKMRLLYASIAGCLLVITVLFYNTWNLSKEVGALKTAPFPAAINSAPQRADIWPDNFNPWSGDWDPSGQFDAARKRMDQMMNSMLPGKSIFSHRGFGLSPASPRVSMTDTDNEYRIVVDVNGGQDVELNTNLENGVLTISGVVNSSTEDHALNTYARSHSSARFSQSMTLPEPVDESALNVDHSDDQIVVVVPKLTKK